MERITKSRDPSSKMSQEAEDFPFSQTEEVGKAFEKNEKVEGLWGIKNMSFERESWRKSHKEKEGKFLEAAERPMKVGEHKIITATIHMTTKFSLSVNTHYPEYREEMIELIWVGVCSAGWMEGQWGDDV